MKCNVDGAACGHLEVVSEMDREIVFPFCG